MKKRYVVRLNAKKALITLEKRKKIYEDPKHPAYQWYLDKKDDWYKKETKRINEFDGWYVKLGGGITPELSEAQVVGWDVLKKSRAYDADQHDLVEIEIIIKK